MLLNLSYEINSELFDSNIIKSLISRDSFKFLANKKFFLRHPHPFVINFDLNIADSTIAVGKIPNPFLFNISVVELEFKNLDLSIQRNKINDLKKKFQLLIKKERYWRQKEINLNKIKRKL